MLLGDVLLLLLLLLPSKHVTGLQVLQVMPVMQVMKVMQAEHKRPYHSTGRQSCCCQKLQIQAWKCPTPASLTSGNHILEEQLVLVMQWVTFTENDPIKF